MPVKPVSVHFDTCPKQGLEIGACVLHRVGFLAYFCPKQCQDFKPSAAPLYPNMRQVPTPGQKQTTVTVEVPSVTLYHPHFNNNNNKNKTK